MPGQFKSLIGVAVDKQNHVFTTEQEPGRLQMFQYVSDADATAEKAKRDEELQKAADMRRKATAQAAPAQTPPATDASSQPNPKQ